MSRPRTDRIREAFGKAHAYDAHAAPQAATALRLASLVAERGLPDKPRILDMGCGTGALASALYATTRPGLYLCADISPPMLARAAAKLAGVTSAPAAPAESTSEGSAPAGSAPSRPAPLFAAMDAACPALKPGFHLAASNMVLHWVADMAAALAGLWELLAPGGMLAVALPGQDTFRAWRDAHQRLGLPCGLQDFPSATELAAMFPAPAAVTEEFHPLALSRALDLPRHLKRVGGFVPRPGHTPIPASGFRAVLADLDARKPAMGYHVLYALALKPSQE